MSPKKIKSEPRLVPVCGKAKMMWDGKELKRGDRIDPDTWNKLTQGGRENRLRSGHIKLDLVTE